MKKTYYIYLKSHCEYPDYEDEVEANNKESALKLFIKRQPSLSEYPEDILFDNIASEKEMAAI